jgi:hypothetical protein
MNRVESFERIRHGVGLVELERIAWLWINVHSNHLEAGAMVTHPGTTRAAKQVK